VFHVTSSVLTATFQVKVDWQLPLIYVPPCVPKESLSRSLAQALWPDAIPVTQGVRALAETQTYKPARGKSFFLDPVAFTALTLSVGRQEEHPASKKWIDDVSYLSAARCK